MGKGWLNEIFAATNSASVDNKGKLVADGAVKLSANADTTYKEGAIFKYLQDQQIKDLVQTEIRKSIAKDAALQEGERAACSLLDYPLHVARHQPTAARP